jgi:hypothetical protein
MVMKVTVYVLPEQRSCDHWQSNIDTNLTDEREGGDKASIIPITPITHGVVSLLLFLLHP